MLFCYDTEREWKSKVEDVHTGEQDIGIVATHVMMQAWDMGIGSCWVRSFTNKDMTDYMELPENIIPVCFLALGYPAEGSKPAQLHTTFRDREE